MTDVPRSFLVGLALAAVVLVVALWTRAAYPQGALRVVDGDTVAIGETVFRLNGFDAPETGPRARCDSERDLGERAKRRLVELVITTDISLTPIACSCRPGTEGTARCNHARRCAVLKSDGKDVGDILISEGLARPYICGATRCPRRRSWCGASP